MKRERVCEYYDDDDISYIDGRLYLNLSKSTQSTGGLKALNPAASGRYLLRKSLFTFTEQNYIYYLRLLNGSIFIFL